jgi:hypothetical protein
VNHQKMTPIFSLVSFHDSGLFYWLMILCMNYFWFYELLFFFEMIPILVHSVENTQHPYFVPHIPQYEYSVSTMLSIFAGFCRWHW